MINWKIPGKTEICFAKKMVSQKYLGKHEASTYFYISSKNTSIFI